MNISLKSPVTIILIASHIIFNSGTILASATAISSYDSYQNILMTIGSSNKQTNQQLQQEYQKSTLHLSKAENTTKNLQLKIAEQNKKIKSLTTTIEYLRQTEATHQRFQLASQEDLKAKELALNQSQANERLLLDQNQQYKKLAILGGITTSLAIGFIVAEKYWDNR